MSKALQIGALEDARYRVGRLYLRLRRCGDFANRLHAAFGGFRACFPKAKLFLPNLKSEICNLQWQGGTT